MLLVFISEVLSTKSLRVYLKGLTE